MHTGYFISIMIDRSPNIYIVDPFESFDRINIYETNGKTEFKEYEGKFFRGMAQIKCLFPF